VVHPEFAAWCQRNSALLMAITQIG
jgi:hypothetical protein